MPVVDPARFMYERNHFPSLTDKEFEVMVLYCQFMSIQKVAEFLGRTDSVVTKHLNSCKKKIGVESDFELYYMVIKMFVNFEKAFPELNLQQVDLLAAFSFYPRRSSIARRYGIYQRDIYYELMKIRGDLGINDLNSLRMLFFMRITLFL
ncbi:helix-turn-helix transcriptional regulator [Salmonella enterica subsp. enterica serovar Rubislaw]|nr:helix-turn-helix transcriptional regulator [Salmonella enterica subsp. enterica serovar Rubislaw]